MGRINKTIVQSTPKLFLIWKRFLNFAVKYGTSFIYVFSRTYYLRYTLIWNKNKICKHVEQLDFFLLAYTFVCTEI